MSKNKVKDPGSTAAGGFDLGNMLQGMMGGQPGAADWWRGFHYPETVNFDPQKLIGCARSALYAKAVVEGKVVHECLKRKDYSRPPSGTGPVLEVEPLLDNIEELVKALDARLVYSFNLCGAIGKFYVLQDGALSVSYGQHSIVMNCVSLEKKYAELIEKHFHSCHQAKE
jgi:hypothetical protein